MPTATTLKTMLWTLGAIAVINRAGFGDLLTGRDKFLGIF